MTRLRVTHIITISLVFNIILPIYGQNEQACQNMAEDPFFNRDLVVGKTWRVYYTQNIKMEIKCLDMKFKVATPMMIRRIYYDMHDYLASKVEWGAATMLLQMGPAKHEVLLIPDKTIPGRFTGIANVAHERDFNPSRGAVPLFTFQMKLIHGGKFLVVMDCHVGVVTVSAKLGEVPYRAEIAGAAMQAGLENGFQACLKDSNPNESVPNPSTEKVRVVLG